MKQIEVVYYLYIPDTEIAAAWTWWVDQQLSVLRTSRLSDVAGVNVVITMPMHWTIFHGAPLSWNGDSNSSITFAQQVVEYITLRYPFAKILDIRDTGQRKIYEGHALDHLYRMCDVSNINVLYFHSKGMTSNSPSVACWREVLHHHLIQDWPTCVGMLDQYDVVGVKDKRSIDKVMSGNFWWSKSSYIQTLLPPLQSQHYVHDQNMVPDGTAYRYAFEGWVMSGNPNYGYAADTKVDHFITYALPVSAMY